MLDLIQAYENYLSKVKHASANTIASYMRDIRQFSQWLNVTEGIDVIDASQLNIGEYLRPAGCRPTDAPATEPPCR